MSEEPMDVPAVLDALDTVLRLQYRSVLQVSVVAGSVRGLDHIAIGQLLAGYAEAELADTRRLIEKVVALGGEPPTDAPALSWEDHLETAVEHLVTHEEEALAALQAVIPPSGDEPRSEALEHLVEHVILRKQSQVDTLLRALGSTER